MSETDLPNADLDYLHMHRIQKLSRSDAKVLGIAVTQACIAATKGPPTPQALDALLAVVSASEASDPAARPSRSRGTPGAAAAVDLGMFAGLFFPPFAAADERATAQEKVDGDYLLLRRIFHDNTVLVSYMSVSPSETRGAPLRFSTMGRSAAIRNRDAMQVDGYMFVTGDNKVFTVGRMRDVRQKKYIDELRTAILVLQPQDGADMDSPDAVYDMKGIRLGLGRIDFLPRGYRVWCSKLSAPLTKKEKEVCVRDFSINDPDALKAIGEFVPGFPAILEWLSDRGGVAEIE